MSVATLPREMYQLPPGSRDAKGRFVKGSSGNPLHTNGQIFIRDLILALESESRRQGYKNFADVVAKRALQYEVVLVAVLKKVMPDLVQHSGEITYTPEEKIERINRLRTLLAIN